MITRRHALALMASLPAAPALAQPGTGPAGPGLFETGAATHHITRHAFRSADGQRRYRIDMATPRGRPPRRGWPALYMLDGNAAFTILTPADLASVPDLALIAVGYETAQRFDNLPGHSTTRHPCQARPKRRGVPKGDRPRFANCCREIFDRASNNSVASIPRGRRSGDTLTARSSCWTPCGRPRRPSEPMSRSAPRCGGAMARSPPRRFARRAIPPASL